MIELVKADMMLGNTKQSRFQEVANRFSRFYGALWRLLVTLLVSFLHLFLASKEL